MWALLLGLTLAAAVALSHVLKPKGQTPLAALFGGGTGNAASTTGTLVADNSRCFVCHVNFQEEILTVSRAAKNVGCELCHGPSNQHCEDENNITAPDIFYTRDDVNAMCYVCHPAKKLSPGMHKGVIAGTFDRKYCTECHGDHRMAQRTRHWDKKTREAILGATVESERMVELPTR